MSEVLVQKLIKLPTGHQINFLQDLKRWRGVATTGELSPQTSQADNSARQTCRRRGWATFDRYYWRLTDAGREALKAAAPEERDLTIWHVSPRASWNKQRAAVGGRRS